MAKNLYPYAVARIRSKELSLLNSSMMDQLIGAKTEEDCLNLLAGKGQDPQNGVDKMFSAEQKKTRQGAIVDRENKVKELQEQYFGQEGVLAKTSETLFTPIRERVMNTIDKVAKANDCALVLDVAGGMGVIYYVPDIDITDQVLKSLQLGN